MISLEETAALQAAALRIARERESLYAARPGDQRRIDGVLHVLVVCAECGGREWLPPRHAQAVCADCREGPDRTPGAFPGERRRIHRHQHVWTLCQHCGEGRWIRPDRNRSGHCRSCATGLRRRAQALRRRQGLT